MPVELSLIKVKYLLLLLVEQMEINTLVQQNYGIQLLIIGSEVRIVGKIYMYTNIFVFSKFHFLGQWFLNFLANVQF